jgi:hypothetical protein
MPTVIRTKTTAFDDFPFPAQLKNADTIEHTLSILPLVPRKLNMEFTFVQEVISSHYVA